jgi:hypothetical protein
MRGSPKVPGIVLLQCNVRTYGNAYIIAFKIGPLHVHTFHLIDPAIVGNTSRRLPEESSGVWPSNLMLSPPWLRNVSP